MATQPKKGKDQTSNQSSSVTEEEALQIAQDAYAYAYPLVIMELTRRATTNVEAPNDYGKAPVNQFGHKKTFPDSSFTEVVRPNADTLYSMVFYDLSKEPLVISVPDSGGRYYLLPTLDYWTDVFTSRGTRTSGNGAQTFAIVGPDWKGTLPKGVDLVRSPTAMGWMIGRTQTNGPEDYDNVHKFQAGLKTTPFSQWGKQFTWPKAKVNPDFEPKAPPVVAVEKMDAATFFSFFAELTNANPPHANDYPVLDRMRRIGIVPGQPFDFAKQPPEVQRALTAAGPAMLPRIKGQFTRAGVLANGWRINLSMIGTYGTDYLQRAAVAFAGLGANTVEDAIYPTSITDADGKPFHSDNRYVLHFDKADIPPARAFWSLTMYDERQLFTDNPLNRYAIGDRDALKLNTDGSLDLYIQRDSPGADKESNWLPAPKSGAFSMNMRLYWPKPEALDGTWQPPAVKRVAAGATAQA
jgi:hypothetical protein